MNNYPNNYEKSNGYNQQPYKQPNDPGKGNGIASLVLGIIGLCTSTWVALIFGIIGACLSASSAKKSASVGLKRNGLAVAGLVCSIIAIVCGAVGAVLLIALLANHPTETTTWWNAFPEGYFDV